MPSDDLRASGRGAGSNGSSDGLGLPVLRRAQKDLATEIALWKPSVGTECRAREEVEEIGMPAQDPLDPVRLDRIEHAEAGKHLTWILPDPAPGPEFQGHGQEHVGRRRLVICAVPQIAMKKVLVALRLERITVMRIRLLEHRLELEHF